MTGRVLVFNAGSSSLKFQLLEPVSGAVAAHGIVERIGQPHGLATLERDGRRVDRRGRVADYDTAVGVTSELFAEAGLALDRLDLMAVGHRVVHGGSRFRRPTVVDAQVLRAIRDLIPLAPLHNPANAGMIGSAMAMFRDLPHVAVFDTAFFATLPAPARGYAIDRTIARRHRIRRYGFHGISHQYVSGELARLLGRPARSLNQIVLHLGNGASASAISGGRAVDTSMGMTPMEGLVMGTRGGDLDPGVLIHLQRTAGMGVDDIDALLNRRSGMVGMCGALDLRDVHRLADAGDRAAGLALEVYCYRIRKYVGAYLAVLGGADAITFTAGVGENDADVRARSLAGLQGLGIVVDDERNTAPQHGPRIISPDGAPVTIAVIPTNEELAIARQAAALVSGRTAPAGPARE